MAEPEESAPKPSKRSFSPRMLLTVAFAFITVWAVGGLLIGLNTFGQNVSGTVTCANGSVTGVFIQAERLPRLWGTGIELQAGFASWSPKDASSATFDYWLPYGGAYSIHFGCGTLMGGQPGEWASDNQTPFVRESGQEWWCNNPPYRGYNTVVVTECRSS